MSTLDRQFVFVIGAPRSGTSWLHQMLAAHPGVAAMPEELTVFSRYLAPWNNNFTREQRDMSEGKWRQGLPCLFTEEEFDAVLKEMMVRMYDRVLQRAPSATHILDKHPNYSNHIRLIDRLLPGSRFIHLIRDGREVAVSMMSVRQRVGHSPGEVRGAAREWHRCITNARRDGAALGPERYMEMRYEDLKADTPEQFTRVCRFAGFEHKPEEVAHIVESFRIERRQVSSGDTALNALRHTSGAIWKQRLGLRERRILDLMAGDLLRSLGYAERGWWALGPMDRLRMLPEGLFDRIGRSARSLRNIWSTPTEERLGS